MNLYDFVNSSGRDYDVADTVFDIQVTVCCIATERDSYDKFCNDIIKKVKFVRHCGGCVLEFMNGFVKSITTWLVAFPVIFTMSWSSLWKL